jgi:hypothetical protein
VGEPQTQNVPNGPLIASHSSALLPAGEKREFVVRSRKLKGN